VFRHIAGSFAFAFAIVMAAPAHATDFLLAIEDVPLATGLVEQADPLVFESEQGRVVRTRASGNADYSALRSFYLTSLPQLGWTLQGEPEAHGPIRFVREHEILAVSIEPAGGVDSPVSVVFELVVKLASTRLPE
jgi:hypothetical protein